MGDDVQDCAKWQSDYLAQNATRPPRYVPAIFTLIALAPWFSTDCAKAYLRATQNRPVAGLVFYQPRDFAKHHHLDADAFMDGNDGLTSLSFDRFPVIAVSNSIGEDLMTQHNLYSGNVEDIPDGVEIRHRLHKSPRDFVQIWTKLEVQSKKSSPLLWECSLIAIASLVGIIVFVRSALCCMERHRRKSLRRLVKDGKVDLEATGIKRMVIPEDHIKSFPVFTYCAHADSTDGSSTRGQPPVTVSDGHSRRSRKPRSSTTSSQPSLAGEISAPASNFQPQCQICQEDFIDRVSIIRELPCQHIYHRSCIDYYLSQSSALCPICKSSMLPPGHIPELTTEISRYERSMRSLRQQVAVDNEEEPGEKYPRRWMAPFARAQIRPKRLEALHLNVSDSSSATKSSAGSSFWQSKTVSTEPVLKPDEAVHEKAVGVVELERVPRFSPTKYY